MRIAFFSDNYLPQVNGIVTAINLLTDELERRGHQVLIVTSKHPHYKDLHPRVQRLPSIPYLDNPPTYLGLPISASVFRALQQFRPQVIHNHSFASVGILGYMVAKFSHLPLFFTYHTAYTDPDYARIFKGLARHRLGQSSIRSLGAFTCNLADYIIAPSPKVEQILIADHVTKPITLIPNGIDTSSFIPHQPQGYWRRRLDIPETAPVVVYCGRLDFEKHVDLLIGHFSGLTQILPSAHLLLVGAGGELANLRTLCKKLKLSSRVHFAGMVDRSQVPDLLQEGQVFASTSTSEVHPFTSIEAASLGLPIVSAADSAYDGLVVDGRNGYQVPVRDPAFAARLAHILNHPGLAAKFSQASKAISRRYTVKSQVDKLLRLYKHPPAI